jgi:ParB-like chromosome segregation protein Spo0J
VPVIYIETRDVPLGALQTFPGNARRGDIHTIRDSIKRHGQYRSLIVREHDGQLTILAGNNTFAALAAENRVMARCEIVSCSDDDARRVNLADNKIGESGTYDDDALVELLSYLDEDYTGTGWTEEDVTALLEPKIRPMPPEPDPERAPSSQVTHCNTICFRTGEHVGGD